jgi:beta-barrel assembly-enhancing protease
MKRFALLLATLTVLMAGCQTLEKVSELGTAVGTATGALTQEQAESINRTSAAVGKTFDSITPEQEYYIGRTVAATILSGSRAFDDKAANDYLNVIGQYLALCSDRPETFGGYHFLIMDTDDINAFAAPGGLILVSRGMLRCCRGEDALAAVLAHEVGHVQFKHGLQAINKGRVTSALTVLAAESAKNLGGQQLAELTKTFEGSISDITSTLVNSGYSRHFEQQADAAAVTILKRAGYDPHGLTAMLTEMSKRLKPSGRDFAKTHPDPKVRIEEVNALIGPAPARPAPAARQARFDKAMAGI